LRSVYFARRNGEAIAASAAKLAAQACDAGQVRKAPMAFRWGYPGMRTPYAGVLRLPPNSSLDLASGAVRRFFPLEPIEPCEIEESWDYAFARARQAVAGAAKRKPVLVSLTSGLDSRTTLAATRGLWPKLTFFTYRRGRTGSYLRAQKLDVLVASDIARSLGLRHLEIDYSRLVPDPSVMAAVRSNSFHSHQQVLACAYHRQFGGHRYIHFRTNLLELTRSNLYRKSDSTPDFSGGPATAQQMARFYAFAGKRRFDDRQVAAFEEYRALTDFDRALTLANAWDLFFVEHRMGAWQSGVVAESDVAFETLIAFNSRDIVRRFMGVPQKIRSTSPSLRKRLGRLLPEIARIPINPRTYSPRYVSEARGTG
jgi:hypothetical protein